MAEQLTFDLPVKPALGREDFFVSDINAHAVATLASVDSWPMSKQLLIGEAGSGKTHLVHVWAQRTRAKILDARQLNDFDPAQIEGPCAIEDVEQIAGDTLAETTLFHVHNIMAERHLPLLITARLPARDWKLGLPDLASRMQATAAVRLPSPDEPLLGAVLLKLFADRQLLISPNLMPYLLRRMERSFAAANDLVDALDLAALRQNRAVTRPLARAVLDKLYESDA